ncbi:MAG: glycosyl transferase [Candidatus Vogelbacteria bacterium]|nr:glycosyl transferase [Candidatus Vogelbacteria bacterium]
MDDTCYETLSQLTLSNIYLIKLSDIEDERLLVAKNNRTQIEYCWTLSSSLPLYILKKTGASMITYLDADLFFYTSPEEIYDEFGDNSIMIIPHRFTKKNIWQEKTSGIYNVGMVIFRNDINGLECLKWWREKSIEWCYDRLENGKYGDQLYLNDWAIRFNKVCVLKNHGANVASWNIARYKFFKKNNQIWMTNKETGEQLPLIFYHFHGLKIYLGRCNRVLAYPITIFQTDIYKKYLATLNKQQQEITKTIGHWSFGFVKKLDPLRLIKQNTTSYIKKLISLVAS